MGVSSKWGEGWCAGRVEGGDGKGRCAQFHACQYDYLKPCQTLVRLSLVDVRRRYTSCEPRFRIHQVTR